METPKQFKENQFEKAYIALYIESNQAYWDASITGNAEDWAKYEASKKKLNAFLSDKTNFEHFRTLLKDASGTIEKRELETICLLYKGNQVDPAKLDKIAAMAGSLEKIFNNFRAEYKGKLVTDNEVQSMLRASLDSAELQAVWEAHKKIGTFVAEGIKTLVKLRNEVAIELGYKNYFDMALHLSEIDPEVVMSLFDELDLVAKDLYASKKAELDKHLAEKYKVNINDLQPWHYQDLFFQYAPSMYKLNIDNPFKDKDLPAITSKFFESIGLDISDLMKNSDLYPKPGKHQQAFHLSVDRKKDIRVLCNISNNSRWMGTMLHEFGHSAFDYCIDPTLPFVLREPAHIFITEGIAMFFGRMPRKPAWLSKAAEISEAEKAELEKVAKKSFALGQLVFNRWSQVMFRFEKSLYEDPDQDLNKKWWELVERYQLMRKPLGRDQPDWATKIHIVNSPCYYHNYLLGQVFAAQINFFIWKNVLGLQGNVLDMDYCGKTEVGKYLAERVFKYGKLLKWDGLVKAATEEALTIKYYANELTEGLKQQCMSIGI
eukprot:TRINITY_DN106049_c0_g1_i1.p1 TRINITY_DN106049_c0_g1~~TRINITY_DN106049_c0_g1_i1.p1  ORF type:complete len:568 (-),score=64.96 TRINITY_DN106049_c0_g1_i1:20-1657(-)